LQDPIRSFLRIRELYLSYLDTAFRILDRSVAAERGRLLRAPGTMCMEPLVEPLPRYEPYQAELHELLNMEGIDEVPLRGFEYNERKAFVELVLAGLFPSEETDPADGIPTSRKGLYPPYSHQVEMLRRGIRDESPGIVTSGTGSGKTEAFLLPVFAALAKEAKKWLPHGDAPPYDLRLSLRGIWIEPAFELNRETLSRIVDELLDHFWARRHVRFSPLLGCVAAPLLHEVLSVRIEDVSFPAVCRAFPSGRCWVRTSDLCRVKAALSR
jgi:hypothetical protein